MRTRRIGPREPHYLGYRDEHGRARIIHVGPGLLPYELPLPVRAANDAKGFDWGNTTASAQLLSAAILRDYLSDDELAARVNRSFTEMVIGKLAADRPWRLLFRDIDAAVIGLKAEAA
jgi:Family of unknown function (DUF6166)